MRPLSPTSPLRELRISEATRAYEAYLEKGMSLADYPGETIQCRNELDRTNWLGLTRLCENAIRDERAFYEANGLPLPPVLGDFPIPEPGIRCTSNTFIRPTVAATITMMDAVLVYAKDAQAKWWRDKDDCRSAVYRDELEALNFSEGWP